MSDKVLSEMPPGALDAARLLIELQHVVRRHRLEDATIRGVRMSALVPQSKPVTKRESMAACLLAASWDAHGADDVRWTTALGRLREPDPHDSLSRFWRMADAAIEHIPYLDGLPPEPSA